MLLVVAGLVIGDAVLTMALPMLVQQGVDGGVVTGNATALWVVTAIAAVLVVLSFADNAVNTVLTARVGERLLYLLRVRSYAHLQRLGLDYFEREMAGRIMTRMTTDVDALSTFLQTGLASALASVLTIVAITVALVVTDAGLALVALAALPVLVAGDGDLPATVHSGVHAGPRTGERGERGHAGERVRAAGGAGVHAGGALGAGVRRTQRHLPPHPAARPALRGDVLPVRRAAGRGGAGGGAGGRRAAGWRRGELPVGVLLAFMLYLNLFFAPVQQLSGVFDGYQQARVGLRRIADLLRTPSSVAPPASTDARCPPKLARRGGAARRVVQLPRHGPARR